MVQKTSKLTIVRLNHGVLETIEDTVVKETALTIYFNEQELVTLLCTPEHLDELAIGFLTSEGLLKNPEEISKVYLDHQQGIIRIAAVKSESLAQKLFLKRYITTGCGKGTTFYHIMDSTLVKNTSSELAMTAEQIFRLLKKMQEASTLYHETGGVHSAALAQGDEIIVFREDVGRHNAVDKIFGRCFLDQIALDNKVLLTSGRISSEILLKVAKRGVGMLISRAAPTDLAVKLAQELGITLIGFVRGMRMNIYSHKARVNL